MKPGRLGEPMVSLARSPPLEAAAGTGPESQLNRPVLGRQVKEGGCLTGSKGTTSHWPLLNSTYERPKGIVSRLFSCHAHHSFRFSKLITWPMCFGSL